MVSIDTVPEVLWQPKPERIARARITDFAAFAAARSGRDLPDYGSLVVVLHDGSGGLLVRGRRLLRACAGIGRPERVLAAVGDARRGVVSWRHAELRRTRAGRLGHPAGHRTRR